MRTSSVFVLLLVGFVAACAQPAPEPMVDTVPLSEEPVSTGKYK
jgi:hypothetical protein